MKYFDFGDGQGYVPAREHPNGGGMVAATAHVDETVFLNKWAVVFGHARITGRVRISGHARISGTLFPGGISTLIEDDVVICGQVVIQDCVLLRDHAVIRDNARITGSALICHRAEVCGDAQVSGDVKILDNAYISGSVRIYGQDRQLVISGEEVICCDGEIRTPADIKRARRASTTKRKGAGAKESAAEVMDMKSRKRQVEDDSELDGDEFEDAGQAPRGQRIAA